MVNEKIIDVDTNLKDLEIIKKEFGNETDNVIVIPMTEKLNKEKLLASLSELHHLNGEFIIVSEMNVDFIYFYYKKEDYERYQRVKDIPVEKVKISLLDGYLEFFSIELIDSDSGMYMYNTPVESLLYDKDDVTNIIIQSYLKGYKIKINGELREDIW